MRKTMFAAWIGGISVLMISFISSASAADQAIQLLKDRGIAVLADSFTETGTNTDADSKAHLTIQNLTMHTLKVDLNGQSGQYHLQIDPRTDKKWRINPGEYHFELLVPGLPSASSQMQLNSSTNYKWEILRKQP